MNRLGSEGLMSACIAGKHTSETKNVHQTPRRSGQICKWQMQYITRYNYITAQFKISANSLSSYQESVDTDSVGLIKVTTVVYQKSTVDGVVRL